MVEIPKQMMIDFLEGRLSDLEDAWKAHNWARMGEVVHRIKGTSTTVGLDDLFPLSKAVEEALERGSSSLDSLVQKLTKALMSHLQRIQ